MDAWVGAFTGTLIGQDYQPRAVGLLALALSQALPLFFLSEVVPSLSLGGSPGELTISEVDGTALTTAASCKTCCTTSQ